MKTKPIFPYLMLCFIFIAFSSCNKKKNCVKNASEIQISAVRKQVVVGWPIRLSTSQEDAFDYHWKGPQTDVLKSFNDSDRSIFIKENASYSDAGTYTVQLEKENCVGYQGSIDITVIDPPSEPCTLQDNHTTNTSIIGVGGVNFTNVEAYDQFPPVYTIEATNGTAQSLAFTFRNGGIPPKPGVYKSTTDSSLGNYMEDITVSIGYSMYTFNMKPGFDVYVTKVNGKLHLAFCDAEFFNPINNNPIVISGSITLP